MEETMVNGVSQLASYGALGIIAAYFMVKDWILIRKVLDFIEEATVTMEKLCIKVDGIKTHE